MDQNLHASVQHLLRDGAVHRKDGAEVGFTRAKCVECFDIRVMGDQDHIEVGRDVPRKIGGLGDAVVLVGRLGHGIILSRAGL